MCDQFVDRTSGRADTFFDGPIVTHLSSAEIYDPVLRELAIATIRDHGIEVHERGTIVIIQGPRFSTKAESKWFSDAGWEVISMTQYPEAWLCRELGMAVVNISLITDYDAGVIEGTEAVNAMSVLEVFQQNAERIQARGASISSGASRPTSTPSGRAPPSSRRAATATRCRQRTSGCSRRACERMAGPAAGGPARLPIGVCIRTIRAEPGVVAGERQAPGRGGLCRGLGLGPLHGPRRTDRPGRRVLDDPVDGGRRDGTGDGRLVRA